MELDFLTFPPTLILLLGGTGCGPQPDRSRNVILISLDNLIADHMKSYGSERDTTRGIGTKLAEGTWSVFTPVVMVAPASSRACPGPDL